MSLYRQCDRGMAGMVWPDGGAVLDQPMRLISAFNTIGGALAKFRKKP